LQSRRARAGLSTTLIRKSNICGIEAEWAPPSNDRFGGRTTETASAVNFGCTTRNAETVWMISLLRFQISLDFDDQKSALFGSISRAPTARFDGTVTMARRRPALPVMIATRRRSYAAQTRPRPFRPGCDSSILRPCPPAPTYRRSCS